MKDLTVAIAYNNPRTPIQGRELDFISERGVLEEVNAVEEALRQLGHISIRAPLEEDPFGFIHSLKQAKADLIFNLVEGYRGNSRLEMNFPALYELMGIPYTGSPPLALGLAVNKALTKRLLKQHHIPTPRFQIFQSEALDGKLVLRFPLIVKPQQEDASLGIDTEAVAGNIAAVQQRVKFILENYRQPALVEEYIEGRELNISLLGDADPEVLPISEVDFSQIPEGKPKICSYKAKWLPESEEYEATPVICPAQLEAEIEEQVKETARQAFLLISCRDYARVDIRLSWDNVPYVLEVNPNPDISPDAGLARSVRKSGRSYIEFIAEIIRYAFNRN